MKGGQIMPTPDSEIRRDRVSPVGATIAFVSRAITNRVLATSGPAIASNSDWAPQRCRFPPKQKGGPLPDRPPVFLSLR